MNYKYFLNDYHYDVYRMLNNGKKLYENANFVDIYIPKGKWSNESKDIRKIFDDQMTGWFDEESDEITEEEASEIMKKLDEAEAIKPEK